MITSQTVCGEALSRAVRDATCAMGSMNPVINTKPTIATKATTATMSHFIRGLVEFAEKIDRHFHVGDALFLILGFTLYVQRSFEAYLF